MFEIDDSEGRGVSKFEETDSSTDLQVYADPSR